MNDRACGKEALGATASRLSLDETTRSHPAARHPRASKENVMTTRKIYSTPLEAELKLFDELPRSELKRRWKSLFGTSCPAQMSRIFLVRALAHRVQEGAHGGLDRATRRRLDKAAADLKAGRAILPAAPTIKPGTRLLREWHGTVHEVIVLEKGVEYRDKTWPSLSAVAREITGTRWSGPRFFGLKGGA
jgi:hypothetical protein